MAGNRVGGLKAAATNKSRYGNDWYAKIGRKGGQNGNTGGFASQEVGRDGLTGAERAKIAGAKGGALGHRGKANHQNEFAAKTAENRKRLMEEIRALEAEEEWDD